MEMHASAPENPIVRIMVSFWIALCQRRGARLFRLIGAWDPTDNAYLWLYREKARKCRCGMTGIPLVGRPFEGPRALKIRLSKSSQNNARDMLSSFFRSPGCCPQLRSRFHAAPRGMAALWMLVFSALLAAPAMAQTRPSVPSLGVVQPLDWARYLGKWYEIARLPNAFQRKCVANVTAEYSQAADGNIQVMNRCERDDRETDVATGEARRTDGDAGKLKVRFAPRWLAWLPVVWGDYWVIGLDDDYQTALVGTPDREYLWLLSRQPQRTAADIDAWMQRAAASGFDTSRVIRTNQTAINAPLGSAPTSAPTEITP